MNKIKFGGWKIGLGFRFESLSESDLTDAHLVDHLQLHPRPELRADGRPELRVEVDGQRPRARQTLHQELAPVRVLAHDCCESFSFLFFGNSKGTLDTTQ